MIASCTKCYLTFSVPASTDISTFECEHCASGACPQTPAQVANAELNALRKTLESLNKEAPVGRGVLLAARPPTHEELLDRYHGIWETVSHRFEGAPETVKILVFERLMSAALYSPPRAPGMGVERVP